MSVDQATVRRIAHLARIAVKDEDVPHLQQELNAILAFVEELGAVEVKGVEPMTSVIPMKMKLRAAMAGYILRKWSVDRSPDHSLHGHEFRLWLKDPLALYGVKNAVLAPGYRYPDKNKGEP